MGVGALRMVSFYARRLNEYRCSLHFIEHKLQSDNLIFRMNGDSGDG